MTVEQMLLQMGSGEFAEWMAFDRLEPIGQLRGDLQAAVVAQVVAEVNRDRKQRRKPFSLTDFMPVLRAREAERKRARGWQGMLEDLKAHFGW